MSQQLYSLSLDSIKLLTGLIRDLASVSEGIDNLHLADDKTFSNIYIKNLVDKCLEDANAEAQKLVGALTHLTCEETTVQPTLDNSEVNVIYLYSADGNAPYQQYLKISDTKLVDLGSTSISLTDYIKAADVAKDYATKTELKAVTDKIGTTTLTTTAQTLTGSIEEVKGIAEQGALLTVTKTQYDQLVAGQTVNIDGKDYTYDSNTYYVVKDESDSVNITSNISSTSTDSEVPSALATFNLLKTVYPVGSIYINTTDVNPSTIFGFGTWERVAQNMTLWGSSADGEVGTTKSAGLPNITGRIGYFSGDRVLKGNGMGELGAFDKYNKINSSINNVSISGTADSYYFDFDASLSNSIYGNSNTVQPPALVINIWKRTA